MLGCEILEGIWSNYSTLLCSKKCLKRGYLTLFSLLKILLTLKRNTIRDGGSATLLTVYMLFHQH